VYVPGWSIWIVPGSKENSVAETETSFAPPGEAAEFVSPLLLDPQALSARAADATMMSGAKRIPFLIRRHGPIGLRR